MRILSGLLICCCLAGCAQNINSGNFANTPIKAAEHLHRGETRRGQAFLALGSPNTISYTDQVLWSYAGQAPLYPPETREIWSYYASDVAGLAPLTTTPIRSRRQMIRVFFDADGVVTGWDALPLNN